MRVVFRKEKRGLCIWTAYPPKRRPITAVGGGGFGRLPHDLSQFVVERDLQHRYGFWGCVADGATFRSLVRDGRKRTNPGKAVIAAHIDELNAAEHDANLHVGQWRNGVDTPMGPALDELLERWTALAEHKELELDFPLATPQRARERERKRDRSPAKRA